MRIICCVHFISILKRERKKKKKRVGWWISITRVGLKLLMTFSPYIVKWNLLVPSNRTWTMTMVSINRLTRISAHRTTSESNWWNNNNKNKIRKKKKKKIKEKGGFGFLFEWYSILTIIHQTKSKVFHQCNWLFPIQHTIIRRKRFLLLATTVSLGRLLIDDNWFS